MSFVNSTILDMGDESFPSDSDPDGRITSLVHLSPLLIQGVYYIIALAGVIGNSIVIVVMFITPALHDVPNYLITNQSFIDLFSSFIFLLNYAIFVDPDPSDLSENPFLAQFICKVWRSGYIYWATVRVSTANLMCLTAERYYAVCHAVAYRKNVRKHHVVVVAIFAWVVGFLYQSPMVFYHNVHEDGVCRLIWPSTSGQGVYGLSILFSSLLVPVAFMTFVYIKIWNVLRQGVQPGGGGALSIHRMKAKRNVIKTLVIVTVVYAICWAPILVFFTMFNIGLPVDFGATFRFIFLAMGYSNSVVNPFIYAFKYRQFQKATRALFRCNRNNQVRVESVS